jgi:choline-sulfatase
MNHKKGNILIIMADQLSALALGCYRHPQVISPNIDRLAAEGVVFDTAYSSSPLCTPARYAFMTGQYVSRCGGFDNAAYLPSTMPTFAHYLRLLGYRTCLSGKMHFVGPDQLHGFESRLTTDIYPADFGWVPDWHHPEDRIDLWYHNMSSVKQAGVAAITNQLGYDDEVGNQAVKAIYDHARGDDDRPLCLVASFIHPHDPYAARKSYWDQYQQIDINPPKVARGAVEDPHCERLEKVIGLDAIDVSADDISRARRAYYANITYVDEWVGKLRRTLEECGLVDDTTILFTSDHGDMLGERGLWYKMSFLEWSCRIPLVIWNPNQFSARRATQPVSHVDILPTLIDIAVTTTNQAPPEIIDPWNGQSLNSICHGDDSANMDCAISEYLAEGTGEPMLMIRSDRYKFIRCATDPDLLFDLDNDADELVNLAQSPAHAAVMQRFNDQAMNHWDAATIKQRVIDDQDRRRKVHAALSIGARQSWDYNPQRDASEEYTRSHMELTASDVRSRFPRPPTFSPRQT